MGRQLGYCTNVHAGSDLDRMRENLSRYCLAVKDRFAPGRPMGVGLWLAAPVAKRLRDQQQLAEIARWLDDHGLIPFTFNGFPYGDFHEPVVKHRVYHPTWFDESRLQYTLDLIEILHAILPTGIDGSISTLPIAWRFPEPTEPQLAAAVRHLRHAGQRLADLEEHTGRLITLCLEPEPGCALQRCSDIVSWFEDHLCADGQGDVWKRYIRVCHDICHSAVMFEDQTQVLSRYADHDIQIGKVQVSSAIQADFNETTADQHDALLKVLTSFGEDRYLHQTTVQTDPRTDVRFFDDLPAALAETESEPQIRQGKWRVHFHVPIYLDQFRGIRTTRDDIRQCLKATNLHPDLTHFEVETYAWSVLPMEMQCVELADGIAQEMSWLQELMGEG